MLLEFINVYCCLIIGLFDVVFEVVDVVSDFIMICLLVVLFNFMQGKEYVGQEWVWGVIGFVESYFDSDLGDWVSVFSDF